MKIYVMHYTKLMERKIYIIEQFRLHNITNYEFIEKYNQDDTTHEEAKFYEKNYTA